MSTITKFDLERFTRAAEECDAATQLSMYGPNAVVTIADKVTQPGTPRVLRTRDEIRGWLDGMFGGDITHRVLHRTGDESGAAYALACRYPDGTNAMCATVFELKDGLIAGQTVVQAWDEA